MSLARLSTSGILRAVRAYSTVSHHQTRIRNIIKLTPAMIANSRVIAKGNRIREVMRLVRRYGGRVSGRIKKSSPSFMASGIRYEYHWYEHHGIGRVKIKRKPVRRS